MPKKPRVVTQKQRQRQSVNVTINQERPIRRRGPNKPKPGSGGGGGPGPGPNQPPQISPIQYQMNAPPPPPPGPQGDNASIAQQVVNLLQRPASIVGEIPPNFNETRFYQNQNRFRPFSNALNPEVPEDRPLPQFDRSPPPPNPVLPDIVEDQNNIIRGSTTPVAIPIASSSYIPLGFSLNQPINQLPSVNSQFNAFHDFGGNDAQQRDIYYEKRLNQERFYKQLSEQMPSGTFSPQSTSSEPPQKSNKGRPFTALSEDDKQALTLYLDYKDRDDKRQYSSTEMYKRGRKLVSQNKSNNPEVMQFIADRSKKA